MITSDTNGKGGLRLSSGHTGQVDIGDEEPTKEEEPLLQQEGIQESISKAMEGCQEPGWMVPERQFIVVTDVTVLQACKVFSMVHVCMCCLLYVTYLVLKNLASIHDLRKK